AVGPEDLRVLVTLTERVDAVERGLGATVPELTVVEDGVDHRRRVARLSATRVDAVDVEDGVGHVRGHVFGRTTRRGDEIAEVDAGRRHDVVAVTKERRVTIRRVGELG